MKPILPTVMRTYCLTLQNFVRYLFILYSHEMNRQHENMLICIGYDGTYIRDISLSNWYVLEMTNFI